MDFATLLWSVFVPGLLAFGFSAIGAALLFIRKSAVEQKSAITWRSCTGHALIAAAIATAFVLSFRITEGWPDMPPHLRWQWVLFIGLWSGVVAIAASAVPREWSRWWCALLVAIVLAVPSGFMLQPIPMIEQPWLCRFALMAAIALTFLSLHVQSDRRSGAWMPLALMVQFSAASVVVIEAGFAKLGLMAAAVAAACGGLFIVSLIARQLPFTPGPAATIATLLPTLMMLGWFYNEGDVPPASFVLIALAPFALWMAEMPMITQRGFAMRLVAWIAVVVIVPAIAVALATWDGDDEPDPYEYYYSRVSLIHCR